MNTVISGISGGVDYEIMLTTLSRKELDEVGVAPDEHDTALLTVRSQKDTDLGIPQLEKLGKACLRAAKMLKARRKKAR